jgi:hypothetical protein
VHIADTVCHERQVPVAVEPPGFDPRDMCGEPLAMPEGTAKPPRNPGRLKDLTVDLERRQEPADRTKSVRGLAGLRGVAVL